MTENKRFTTDNGSNEDVCLVDNNTGVEYEDNFDDIVDVLNQLNDENDDLKGKLELEMEKSLYWRNKAKDIFGDMKTNVELKRENVQLKQRIKELEIGENEIILKQETTINQLIKENKQLKQRIKELRQYLDWDKMELEELEDINKNVIR